MPTRERGSIAQSPDLDARAEAKRRAVPALANHYDRTAMGTLPAQRGGGMAGITPQGSGYRGDQAQADGPGTARKSIHRNVGCPHFHAKPHNSRILSAKTITLRRGRFHATIGA